EGENWAADLPERLAGIVADELVQPACTADEPDLEAVAHAQALALLLREFGPDGRRQCTQGLAGGVPVGGALESFDEFLLDGGLEIDELLAHPKRLEGFPAHLGLAEHQLVPREAGAGQQDDPGDASVP